MGLNEGLDHGRWRPVEVYILPLGGAKLFKMPFGRVCSFFFIMIGIVNVGYQLNRTRSHHRDEDLVCQYGSF